MEFILDIVAYMLALAFFVFIFKGSIVSLFSRKKPDTEDSVPSNLPEMQNVENDVYSFYQKKTSVMTEREKRYYKQLIGQYGQDYYVFPQINIDKLVTPIDNSVYWIRNKIDRKSVDFVVADKNTLETVMVIELDDYTHRYRSRQDRDDFVNKLLRRCGVRLERV